MPQLRADATSVEVRKPHLAMAALALGTDSTARLFRTPGGSPAGAKTKEPWRNDMRD